MNWLKYKFIYLPLSGILILVGIFGLLKWSLKLGVDFSGGSLVEYKFDKPVSTEDLTKLLEEKNIEVQSIQETGSNTYLFRLQTITSSEKSELDSLLSTKDITIDSLRFESVGPSIGPELVKKTGYAIAIAAVVILLWVAYQFNNITYGLSAILAMFHDSFILVGAFSLLGHFWGAEVDFLFVTALLTTLSFSVHDTIVVFDRIREISKTEDSPLDYIANKALTETMVRSLNNSFTIIFMLLALLLMGGTTVKWFAAALLIGTFLGTYSSPFVAVPLLSVFTKLKQNFKKE